MHLSCVRVLIQVAISGRPTRSEPSAAIEDLTPAHQPPATAASRSTHDSYSADSAHVAVASGSGSQAALQAKPSTSASARVSVSESGESIAEEEIEYSDVSVGASGGRDRVVATSSREQQDGARRSAESLPSQPASESGSMAQRGELAYLIAVMHKV